MCCLSFYLFLPFLYIIIVFIQQSASAITNNQKKIQSEASLSLLDEILPTNDQIERNINELRCPANWSQLGYSCYLLSDYISAPTQANHTCDLLHLKTSRLMYIQESIQLMFAAHILIKNNLLSLMLEVDQNFMRNRKIVKMLSSNDYIQWEEYENKLKDQKEQIQSSKSLFHKHRYSDDNTIDRETTEIVNEKMNNKSENVDYIRQPCDEIQWNINDENSNILIFTIEIDSNKSICLLSNVNIKAAYSHLCQYGLDRCLNNIMCGIHGRCINSLSGFNCSCSFLYDGLFCEKFSIKDIQLLIAPPILLIGSLLLITSIRILFLRTLNCLFCCCCRRKITSISSKANQNDDKDDKQLPIQHSDKHVSHETRIEFVLTTTEQCIRSISVFIIFLLFSITLIGTPVIRYYMLIEMNKTNSSKFNSVFDDNIHRNRQYGHNTIFRIENLIFLIISIVLTIVFSFLNTQDQSNDNNQSSIIEPIKPFYITDRYKTVTIVMIQMFEIFEILDETLIDISEASQSGIFFKILKRMIFVIINTFRYYPVLASLQFQDIKVRCLTFIYIISMIIFMIIRDNSHIYWLSFYKEIVLFERINVHMDINFWSLIYNFVKNCIYWILIGYISAELTMRLFYDSICISIKNRQKITVKTYRKIDKYTFSRKNMKKRCLENLNKHITIGGNNIAENDNFKQNGCWFNIQKLIYDYFHQFQIFITGICKNEDNFRCTTIVIVTYAIAFSFLFHLTFNLIFLYTRNQTNYIVYSKQILERILNIEIKEQSFKIEVIFSAIITMIIYSLQLLQSLKNYKDNITNLYNIYSARRIPSDKPKDDEIISQSVQYPAFILRYLLGGFIICFNLILFILIMSKTIGTRIISFKWTLISIISIIFVYSLHVMINLIINSLFTSYNSQDQHGVRLDRPYSILLYFNLISTTFIGVISSIIRLIASILVNILFMPRIDYSCFVSPLQKLDSAHVSFQCFIHWEFLYTRDILLKFSMTTKPPSNADLSDKETIGIQDQQDEYMDPENNDETVSISYSVNEILHHRSLNHLNQPMPINPELEVALLEDEV